VCGAGKHRIKEELRERAGRVEAHRGAAGRLAPTSAPVGDLLQERLRSDAFDLVGDHHDVDRVSRDVFWATW